MRLRLFYTTLIALILLSGCQSSLDKSDTTSAEGVQVNVVPSIENDIGNNPGNIYQGGFADIQGDYIYYCSGGKGKAALYMVKIDGVTNNDDTSYG